MMDLLLTYCFRPAKSFLLTRQVTYQGQLKRGVVSHVPDNQVQPRILKNTFNSLLLQLKSEYSLYVLNLHTKVRYFRFSTEPDLAITAPHPASFPYQERLNPVVIIEVLCQDDQRDSKFEQYRQIASLCEYVRIEPERYLIEHLVKQPGNEWKVSQIEKEEDELYLASIDGHLSLAVVYDKVTIEQV